MKKRMLALVLTVAMLLSLFPGQVFATETEMEHTEHNFVEVQPETEAPAEELPNATETETPTELPDATEELIETPTDDITETPTEPREEQVAVTPQNPIEGVTVPSVEELSGTVGQIKATPKADEGHNHCLLSHDCLDGKAFGKDCSHYKNYIGIDKQWFEDIVGGKTVAGVRYQKGTTNILYLGTTQTVSFYLKSDVTLPGTIDKIVIEPDVPPLPGEEFAVNLCLNGFQLNLTERQIQVYAYGDLRISDCKLNDDDQGNIVSKYDGSTIHVYPNGILRLYDGTVRNIRETGKDTICAVYSTGTVSDFDTTVWSYFLGLFSVGGTSVIHGGHFEGQSAIYQKEGGQLTIEDGTFTSASGRALQIAAGTVDISGGTISSQDGRAIHATGGELNISGGTISSENGRAIHATGGVLNISGGTIESEYLHTVHIEGAEVNITGGKITHKRPESVEEPKDADNNVDHQYAVALGNGTLTVNGADVEINGTRDTALFVGENATATLTAGTIITTGAGMHGLYNKGETTINGSNLNIQSNHYGIFNDLETADLTVTAGTIKGFHGIYNKNGATLNLSGSPEIKGSAKGSDVYLHVPSKATDGTVKYNYITVNGPLNPGGDGTIAVLTKPEPTYGSPVQFTLEWDESDCVMDKFVSARAWYRVELTEDGKELQLALIPHDHCKYGHNYPEGENCGHGEINFKIPLTAAMFEEFAKDKILPEGDYYLVEPIKYTNESLTVSGNVNLCLNGFTITSNSTITVGSTSVLSVYDCDGKGSLVCDHFTLPARSTSTASELHLYGGLIVLSSSSGLGVIDVGGYDIFELDGATIEINSTSTDPGFIYKAGQGGSVHLKSGEIRHNASIPSIYSYGSGALNLQGWVRIDGGTDSPDIQLYASKTNKRIITITGRVTPPEDDSVYTVKLFTSLNITEYQLTNNWEESGLSSKDSDTGKAQIPFVSTQGYAIIEKVADEATGKKELFMVIPEVTLDYDENLGTVSADPMFGPAGTEITVNVEPKASCTISGITLSYWNGAEMVNTSLDVPNGGKDAVTHTFTMPAADVTVKVDFGHKHPVSVDCITGSPIVNFNSGLTQETFTGTLEDGKSYVLMGPVTATNNITVNGTVNLCLNGYTLDLKNYIINVGTGDVLNICDCNSSSSTEGGTIKSSNTDNVIDNSGGELNVYGGSIISSGKDARGIATSGTTNIFGGTIIGTVDGGIYVTSGSLNINGENVHIQGKHGIYVVGTADITVTAGTVVGTAGDGIHINSATGTLVVNGPNAEIIGYNTGIGEVYFANSALDVKISDGKITGNTSHGIYTCGTLTVSGGTITSTSESNSGIYVNSGEVHISGDPTITGPKGVQIFKTTTGALVNIDGGSISGTNGAGIEMLPTTTTTMAKSVVNIKGGTVQGSTSGIKSSGTLTISGGTITGGTESGITISGGTTNIEGGTVTGGQAGADFSCLRISGGTTTITGGEITTQGDHGVFIDKGTLNILDGAVIRGNTVVNNSGGTVTISGGTMESTGKNPATGAGAGVYYKSGTLKLSGAPVIKGTTADFKIKGDTTTGLAACTITIAGPLNPAEPYSVWVTDVEPTEDKPIPFTKTWYTHEGQSSTAPFYSYIEAYRALVKKTTAGNNEWHLVAFHNHYMAVDWENGHADPNNPDVPGKHADGTAVGDKVTFAMELTEAYVKALKIYTDQYNEPQYGLESGNYVLIGDITVDKSISIRGDVKLCLNGHNLILGDNSITFNINKDAKLSICDCKGGGTITSTDYKSTILFGSGTLNLFGGTIAHPVKNNTENPVFEDGIQILPSAIRCSGTLNMYGGTITSDHHGIYTVSEDTAVVQIFGGTIEAKNKGAGVYSGTCKTIEIKGETVQISGHTALTANGGDVTVTAGTLTSTSSNSIYIEGGNVTVRENAVVQGKYDAIALMEGTLNLADAPTITSTGGNACILLNHGMVINILDDIGATYSVTTKQVPTAEVPVRITTNWTNSGSTSLEDNTFALSSKDGYTVRRKDNELWLVIVHKHFIAVDTKKGLPNPTEEDPEHNDSQYVVFDREITNNEDLMSYLVSNSILPAGNYVLMGDEIFSDTMIKITEGTVNLCLKGCTLHLGKYYSDYIRVESGATLNICDCSREDPEGALGSGKISRVDAHPANNESEMTGHPISRHYGIWNEGSLNIYGGTYFVEGSKDISTLYIETTDTQKPAVLNLYSGLVTAKAFDTGSTACHILGVQAFNSGTIVNQYNDARVEAIGYGVPQVPNTTTTTSAVYLYNFAIYYLHDGEIYATSAGDNLIYGVYCTAPGTEFYLYDGLVKAERDQAPDNINGFVRGIGSSGKVFCSGGKVESDYYGIYVFAETGGNGHYLTVSDDALIHGDHTGICNVGTTTVTGGTVIGGTFGVYHHGTKFNLSGSPVITGDGRADIYLTNDSTGSNRVITITGKLGKTVETNGVKEQHFEDLYYVLTPNALNTSTNPIRITEDWGDTHHTYDQSKGVFNHPFRSKAGYHVFVLPADNVAEVDHENQDVYFALPLLEAPLTLYVWKDHDVLITREALLNAMLDCDPAAAVFTKSETYELDDVQFVNDHQIADLTFTPVDGGYKFSSSATGTGTGRIMFQYHAKDNNTVFTAFVEVELKSYFVKDSVFVLDYDTKVDMTRNNTLYQGDILPTTLAGDSSKLLLEGFTNKIPSFVSDAETFSQSINLECCHVCKGIGTVNYEENEQFKTKICDNCNGSGSRGSFLIGEDGTKAIYAPTAFISDRDSVYLILRVHKDGAEVSEMGFMNPFKEVEMYKKVTVLPANVVYYEDNNAALNWNPNGNAGIVIETVGKPIGDGYQDGDNNSEYGNDSDYASAPDGEYYGSGGYSKKITVKAAEPVLTFTFTGTGFDLIGSTTADSGQLMYKVTKKGGSLIQSGALNTVYNGSGETGAAIHEVPLLHVHDLEHGTYEVLIQSVVTYDWSIPKDQWPDGKRPVKTAYLYLDGVRVYNPLAMNSEDRELYMDGEDTARFIQLRDMILKGQAAAAKIDGNGLFSFGSGLVSYAEKAQKRMTYEGNKVTSLNDYLIAGPNNEVYFNENTQTLVLYVKETGEENVTPMLQIGVRNLNPEAFKSTEGDESIAPEFALLGAKGGVVQTLVGPENAIGYTEQYYTVNYKDCVVESINGVSYYRVVITARNNKAFSLTNLKVSGLEFYTIPASAATLRYDENGQLMENTNPDATAMPSLQELAWQLQAANGMLPEDEIPGEVAELKFSAVSLSLQSSIGMNIYVAKETLTGYKDPYVVLTKTVYDTQGNASTRTTTLQTYTETTVQGLETLVFHYGDVAAKEMASNVQLQLFATKEGETEATAGEIRDYSVVKYAMNMLNKVTDSKLKTLLVDMVNYGTQAQVYFDYNTANPANAGFEAYQEYATTQTPAINSNAVFDDQNAMAPAPEGATDYLSKVAGASLLLNEKVELNIFVNYKDALGNPNEGRTLVVAYSDVFGNTVVKKLPITAEDLDSKSQFYRVTFSSLNATDMRTAFSAWVVDKDGMRISNSMTYSIESYCASMIAGDGAAYDKLRPLLIAMMKYGDSAEAYFEEPKTEEA